MTGERLRIDCAEFRRKPSWETLEKLIFMIWGIFEKSIVRGMPPKCSLEAPAAPKMILGGPRMLPK